MKIEKYKMQSEKRNFLKGNFFYFKFCNLKFAFCIES